MDIKDEKILTPALKRWRNLQQAEDHNRAASLEDLHFVYNEEEGQWDAAIRTEREADRRPILTANKLRKYVAQVANKERDAMIAGDVEPVDDMGDPQTAMIYEGIIRQIEYRSKAEEIYTNGGEQAVAGGFGYWRWKAQYVDDGFEQEIILKGIPNQFSVHLDPRRQYGFIREGITKADFKKKWPNAQTLSWAEGSTGEEHEFWYEDDKLFVAEYFDRVPVKKTLVRIRDTIGRIKDIYLTKKITRETLADKGIEIIKEREVDTYEIRWYKMTSHEILAEAVLPGKSIPIIECKGDEVNIAGKVYKRSLVRDAKDPQRMYNYWLTAMTEQVALVPKAPFIATPEQIAGHETDWHEANRKNKSVLLYNADGSTLVPKREQPAQIPTGAMGMLNINDKDIMDTLGMYEASVGQKGNERSGRAIFARSARADIGTYHFPDNYKRAIIETMRQLIDVIPQIYDTERIVRLRDFSLDDQGQLVRTPGQEAQIMINETMIVDGKPVIYNDISVGKYDIRADIKKGGTRRQEAAESMERILQAVPMVAPIILDLIFKYQDYPGAREVEARVKKYLAHIEQQQQGAQGMLPGGEGEPIPGMGAETIPQGGNI